MQLFRFHIEADGKKKPKTTLNIRKKVFFKTKKRKLHENTFVSHDTLDCNIMKLPFRQSGLYWLLIINNNNNLYYLPSEVISGL